nr:MAG TPA: hypothetical protein [Caudoviricetes sp.]
MAIVPTDESLLLYRSLVRYTNKYVPKFKW